MPNGGSDCCGTCWFNSTNEGQPRFQRSDPNIEVWCIIRNLTIEEPFWTYCANHPHHNPEQIETPVGPLYVDSGEGFPYSRKILAESPDNETIRAKLLELLDQMEEIPQSEYPTSPKLDEAVILQLGLFKERRAVAGLRRVLAFNPYAKPEGVHPFGQNRIWTIAYAIQSLARIVGDEAMPDIQQCLEVGVEEAKKQTVYNFDQDQVVTIRFWAVEALQFMNREHAIKLAYQAMGDPNAEVAQAAKEVMARFTT